MRLLSMSILSASAMLLPALAGADPAQAPAAVTAGSVSASPGAQTSATTPTQGAPSQSPPPTVMQTGPESVVVKADAVDLDQIVCKNAPPPVGSRLGGGRVCHSQREWNRIRNESQDATRHLERMPYAGR